MTTHLCIYVSVFSGRPKCSGKWAVHVCGGGKSAFVIITTFFVELYLNIFITATGNRPTDVPSYRTHSVNELRLRLQSLQTRQSCAS